MKDILILVGVTASPFLFGIVAYFLKDLIHDNKKQHTDFQENLDTVEEKTSNRLSNISKEISQEVKEQAKKILELKETVITVDAKQGRLDIISRQIDEVHKMLDKSEKMDQELQEKINLHKKEVEEVKRIMAVEVPESDYKHIIESEFLSAIERESVKEHIEFLKHAPLQGYKIGPFIRFMKEKIEKKRLNMIQVDTKWRVSDSLYKSK